MPAMANITVKNAVGTDVVFNAATPSAGDRSAARWRQNSASSVIGWRPSLDVTTRDNGRENGRHITAVFKFPIIGVDALANPVVRGTFPLTLEGTIPTNVDSATVNDAFVQFGNLMASSLMRQIVQEGYSAT